MEDSRLRQVSGSVLKVDTEGLEELAQAMDLLMDLKSFRARILMAISRQWVLCKTLLPCSMSSSRFNTFRKCSKTQPWQLGTLTNRSARSMWMAWAKQRPKRNCRPTSWCSATSRTWSESTTGLLFYSTSQRPRMRLFRKWMAFTSTTVRSRLPWPTKVAGRRIARRTRGRVHSRKKLQHKKKSQHSFHLLSANGQWRIDIMSRMTIFLSLQSTLPRRSQNG